MIVSNDVCWFSYEGYMINRRWYSALGKEEVKAQSLSCAFFFVLSVQAHLWDRPCWPDFSLFSEQSFWEVDREGE